MSEPVAEVHPALAALFGIANGGFMRITSRRGSVALRARVTETISTETIFAPFHWGGSSTVNALIGGPLDPQSRMPPFKACAVRIESIPSDADPPNR